MMRNGTEISAVTSPGEVDGDCGEYLDEESGEALDRRVLERDREESPVAEAPGSAPWKKSKN